MTADVELLPLPCPICGNEPRVVDFAGWEVLCQCGLAFADSDCCKERDATVAAWNARANLAHATAAKDAEIEALRAEVERLAEGWAAQSCRADRAEARAERLAEALRGIETKLVHSMDHARSSLERKRAMSECADAALAALEQETTNG